MLELPFVLNSFILFHAHWLFFSLNFILLVEKEPDRHTSSPLSHWLRSHSTVQTTNMAMVSCLSERLEVWGQEEIGKDMLDKAALCFF